MNSRIRFHIVYHLTQVFQARAFMQPYALNTRQHLITPPRQFFLASFSTGAVQVPDTEENAKNDTLANEQLTGKLKNIPSIELDILNSNRQAFDEAFDHLDKTELNSLKKRGLTQEYPSATEEEFESFVKKAERISNVEEKPKNKEVLPKQQLTEKPQTALNETRQLIDINPKC